MTDKNKTPAAAGTGCGGNSPTERIRPGETERGNDSASEAQSKSKRQRDPFLEKRDQWIGRINSCPTVHARAGRLAVFLSDHAGMRQHGNVWFALKTIEVGTGMSRSAVKRARLSMVQNGFLHIVERQGKTNQYWPLLDGAPLVATQSIPSPVLASPRGSNSEPPPSPLMDPHPVQFRTPTFLSDLPDRTPNANDRQESPVSRAEQAPHANEGKGLTNKNNNTPSTLHDKADSLFDLLGVRPRTIDALHAFLRDLDELEHEGWDFEAHIVWAVENAIAKEIVPRGFSTFRVFLRKAGMIERKKRKHSYRNSPRP